MAKISGSFIDLKSALLCGLDPVYTGDVWNGYLKSAGCCNVSKKGAEVFVNACAAKFVCTVLYPLMVSCHEYTAKWNAGLTLKKVTSDINEVLDLVLDVLYRYPDTRPCYTFEQLRQEYPNVVQLLYDSL